MEETLTSLYRPPIAPLAEEEPAPDEAGWRRFLRIAALSLNGLQLLLCAGFGLLVLQDAGRFFIEIAGWLIGLNSPALIGLFCLKSPRHRAWMRVFTAVLSLIWIIVLIIMSRDIFTDIDGYEPSHGPREMMFLFVLRCAMVPPIATLIALASTLRLPARKRP